jgi:hypothetical protein
MLFSPARRDFFAPLQDIAVSFLDARKRTLLALTLAVLEEVSSSADHAQLGQYS